MSNVNATMTTRHGAIHHRDESYKLGWIAGFYGCSVNSPATARPQFATGYDDGLLELEKHGRRVGIIFQKPRG